MPITLRIVAEEPADLVSKRFFNKILGIANEEAFHSGDWGLLEVGPEGHESFWNLITYEWRWEKAWKVIVVKLSSAASQGRVRMGDRVSRGRQYVFSDVLNEVRYLRSGDELNGVGLFVRLEGGQAHIIFDVSRDAPLCPDTAVIAMHRGEIASKNRIE